ncbi:hypothetical protein QR680_014453 [Steinernema hermaphroditum]|uniref:Uncharacterized protein n=1 Tax=Steinernema hermaphroditum TaxID=289476 RepID=A0AA39IAC2_9BILA|nr:hypothetical protein QR680_014453 [Steinernema hermaphroditum]
MKFLLIALLVVLALINMATADCSPPPDGEDCPPGTYPYIKEWKVGPDHFESHTNAKFVMKVDTSSQFRTVVSYDNHFSCIKLMKAMNHFGDQDSDFIVTNVRLIFPEPTVRTQSHRDGKTQPAHHRYSL